MEIKTERYTVTYDDQQTLTIAGKLSAMPQEYEKIEDFFEHVVASQNNAAPGTEMILDIRRLEFLNSSGIKTLCVSLIMDLDDIENLSLKVLCSKKFTWQTETIPTFKDLMTNIQILFE